MQSSHHCKTTAFSSSDSVTPRFHLIYDLFNTNVPITEIVFKGFTHMGAQIRTNVGIQNPDQCRPDNGRTCSVSHGGCNDMVADLHFPWFFGTPIQCEIARRFPRSVVKVGLNVQCKNISILKWGSTLNLNGFKIIIFHYVSRSDTERRD